MLQYIFIHAKASNAMDRKPSRPIPWTENYRVQNHGLKTIGRSAQPNIGSKFFPQGAAPDLVEGGYLPPSNPLGGLVVETQDGGSVGG